MNHVTLIGRLTRDPEVRYANGQNGQMAIASYSLAVDRIGEGADFINCKAFGKNGEFAERWLHKGMKIAVEGSIQTGSYTNKEGQKVYTTDVVINRHEFVENKANGSAAAPAAKKTNDGFMHVPDAVDDDELPFG